MKHSNGAFALKITKTEGRCPIGETVGKRNIKDGKIPVLSCEGGCIRGEIARLAANIVAQKVPSLARCCHAETFLVPHSSMARWAKGAERAVMIDGCFLKCHGRVLKNLLDEGRMIHIDALPLYKKYTDVFLYTDVPQTEREAVAEEVAEKIIALLETETGIH